MSRTTTKKSAKPVLKSALKSAKPVKATIEAKPETKPELKSAKLPDLSTYPLCLRWLHDRTDYEKIRNVQYSDNAFKLDRMRKLLALMGDPQDEVKTVHVAGTVGKGSTVAMIASMMRECGYTVGEFVSPHLVDVRERVVVNGKPISKNDFTDLIRKVAKASLKLNEQLTFFEVMTAIGLKHFANEAVDIAVIEVGLGGRLDSTNVITPEVCVITTIDYDHCKLLGNTLPQIAREKAGIFKKGVTALVFDPPADVEKVFRDVATKVGADLRVVNKDIEFSSRFCSDPDLGPHARVCLYTKTSRLEHLPVPLPGEHQSSNCGLALSAVDILKSRGFDCPENKVTRGLGNVKVPGRMEVISERPRILVDGAHNPASVQSLMKCVGAHVPYDSMVCIFGCCSDKDVPSMLDKVNLGADKVIFTRATTTPRAASPEDLQKMFAERSGKMSQVAKNLPEAIEIATRAVSREDLIVVTGSFYLVGEAIKYVQQDVNHTPPTPARALKD